MRGCIGIKILLVICPSSHRNEDFLPSPEVFWNQRLCCMSFLLSSVLLSWFPACYCSGFPLCSAYTGWAFTKLGFSCAWLPSCWGPAEVASAMLHPGQSPRYFWWNVRFPQFCLAAVKVWNSWAVLELRVLFGKQRIAHAWGIRMCQPQSRNLNPSWLFICFVSSPWTCPMQIRASQVGSMFLSPKVLTLLNNNFSQAHVVIFYDIKHHRFAMVVCNFTVSLVPQ